MKNTIKTIKEALQANSKRLIEAEARSATLEAKLLNDRTMLENQKLELQAKNSQFAHEQHSKGPRV